MALQARLPIEPEQVAPERAAEITKKLRAALRARYAWPEWALLEEISLDTHSYRSSIADAIAVGMWQSSGYGIHGFELKATRSDWLREIRNIGKADAAYRHCHRWWLVAPESIIDPAEIPGTWGWMIPRGSSLRVKRQAPVLKPEPLSMGAMSHIVRVAIDRGLQTSGDEFERRRQEYERGVQDGIDQEKRRYHPGELESLREAVDAFEAASGVKITAWSGQSMGKAVRFIERGGLKKQEEALAYAARYALDALVALSAVVPTIRTGPYGTGREIDLRAALRPFITDAEEDLDGVG